MPLASILIPVYNREGLISATVNSALAQTVRDIEIIVVDNKSDDNTYDVVASLASTDSRIKHFQNDQNIGPVRNWIKCTQLASSPYSKILFSDDLIAPTFLERTLPHILSPDCGLVYSPAIIGERDWKGQMSYKAFGNDCQFMRDHFLRATTFLNYFAPVSPGAALFRTTDLCKHIRTELPGVDSYDFSASGAGVDWLIYALTALDYSYVSYVAEPLSFFRSHPGSISVANIDNQVVHGYRLAKNWFAQSVKGL